MADRVLGVDGGGTKTRAVVADSTGLVLRTDLSGGLDPTAGDGWEASLTTLAQRMGEVDMAVLGLPCHGEIPAIDARQTALVQGVFGAHARVVNDVAVAFQGAFAGGDGVLILAGTGSMAWAQGPLGTHRVGGWGHAFGDEGSACWIGRAALAAVSQHLDGRHPDPGFATALLARLQLAPTDLIAWTYQHTNLRARIAAVASHVSALAAAGDVTALGIMTQAAQHLAQLGRTALATCDAQVWSTAGSVFDDPVVRATTTTLMPAKPAAPRLPPVGGAVLMAARAAGWSVDAAFIAALHTALSPESP